MLRAFSRREMQRPRVDLHTLVAGLQPMLARVFDQDVQFDIEVGTDAGTVGADPVALELVLMTLVVAVREQMPTGGRVSIATKVTTGADDAANDTGGVQLMVTARRWRHDIAIPELASDRWLAPSSPGVNLGHLERVLQANGGWIDTSASTADQLAITIGLASA